MKKTILYSLLALCLPLASITGARSQQALFLTQGNITFERTINILALLKEQAKEDNVWSAKILEAFEKSNNDKTAKAGFNLAFNGQKSLYTPLPNESAKQNPLSYLLQAGGDNTVYSDLDSAQSVSFKNVYDQSFIVKDSLRQIRWKITDETRTIAGFQCRRANAIVMDSIYVVAFYTDMIPTSTGPESFTGLPGMILGLALPHKHVTWFATKVSVNPEVAASSIVPPTGKRRTETVTRKSLFEKLNSRLKDWGDQGNMIMQNALL